MPRGRRRFGRVARERASLVTAAATTTVSAPTHVGGRVDDRTRASVPRKATIGRAALTYTRSTQPDRQTCTRVALRAARRALRVCSRRLRSSPSRRRRRVARRVCARAGALHVVHRRHFHCRRVCARQTRCHELVAPPRKRRHTPARVNERMRGKERRQRANVQTRARATSTATMSNKQLSAAPRQNAICRYAAGSNADAVNNAHARARARAGNRDNDEQNATRCGANGAPKNDSKAPNAIDRSKGCVFAPRVSAVRLKTCRSARVGRCKRPRAEVARRRRRRRLEI